MCIGCKAWSDDVKSVSERWILGMHFNQPLHICVYVCHFHISYAIMVPCPSQTPSVSITYCVWKTIHWVTPTPKLPALSSEGERQSNEQCPCTLHWLPSCLLRHQLLYTFCALLFLLQFVYLTTFKSFY